MFSKKADDTRSSFEKKADYCSNKARSFSTKAIGMVVRLKDAEALKNELKNDYIITKDFSALSGSLALKCGRLLAVANAFLIAAKNVDFSAEEPRLDAAGLNVVPTAKQSSANAE